LTALARAITGSHADALDAVQEAFVAVLALPAARAAEVADESAYLAGAVRGRAVNIVRSSSRRSVRERGEGGAERGGAGAALRLVGQPDDDRQLEEAIENLPLDVRECVALKHLAGLSFDQMAIVLAAPRATVASRYYAAIEQLRSELGAPRSTREVANA
jgi:RNA polymerase sigma-70 factor (ECF subfamily)